VDPLGGSYYVESLTNELEERAWEYVKKIEDAGGMVEAIKSGWIHKEYKAAIIDYERKLTSDEITVVGVNKFRLEKAPYKVPIFKPDPRSPDILIERVKRLRKERDGAKVAQVLKKLEEVVRSDENTLPAILEAAKSHATPGELTDIQLKVYGPWTYPIAG
jgi:methylmalonyl-CoA mutase N-terminal domain/subunit